MYWRINIEHITQTEICIFSLEPLFLRATVSKHASKYRSPFISSMCRSLVSLSFCQYSLTTFSNSFRLLPQIQHLIFSACCILVHPLKKRVVIFGWQRQLIGATLHAGEKEIKLQSLVSLGMHRCPFYLTLPILVFANYRHCIAKHEQEWNCW